MYEPQRHNNYKKLFVNNVACFTAYLANALIFEFNIYKQEYY